MDTNCGCVFSAIISIILGVIIGILVFTGVIFEFWTLAWAAIGIVGFAILLTVLVTLFGDNRERKCLCENGRCLVIGAFGTVLVALAIIAVVSVASIIVLAILFGIGGFFFLLTLISFLKFLLCLIRVNCGCRE